MDGWVITITAEAEVIPGPHPEDETPETASEEPE